MHFCTNKLFHLYLQPSRECQLVSFRSVRTLWRKMYGTGFRKSGLRKWWSHVSGEIHFVCSFQNKILIKIKVFSNWFSIFLQNKCSLYQSACLRNQPLYIAREGKCNSVTIEVIWRLSLGWITQLLKNRINNNYLIMQSNDLSPFICILYSKIYSICDTVLAGWLILLLLPKNEIVYKWKEVLNLPYSEYWEPGLSKHFRHFFSVTTSCLFLYKIAQI